MRRLLNGLFGGSGSATCTLNRAWLGCEQLGDRIVPAVSADLYLVVTTSDDVVDPNDGVLSLREAVAQCNATEPTTQHTIYIGARTITLNPNPMGYGQLSLTKNVEIIGGIVQRDNTSEIKHRLFYVGSSATATLTGIEMRYGNVDGGNGGAVISFGNLVLDGCYIHHNTVTNGTGGGVQAQGGSVTVDWCNFDDNQAVIGGGLFLNRGVSASLYDTDFYHNIASGSGGGIAILCEETGTAAVVTLTNCNVINNEAQISGGGIYVDAPSAGPGVFLRLEAGEVSSNKALAAGRGGGIYFGRGTITFVRCDTPVTIADNTAASGDGLYRVTGTERGGTTEGEFPDLVFVNNQETVGAG